MKIFMMKIWKCTILLIKNLLILNNYPINLINKHINIRIFQIKNKNTILDFIPNNKQSEIDYKRVVSIPYFGNLSYKIKKTFK